MTIATLKPPIAHAYLAYEMDIAVGPTDGTRVISKETDVFTGGIASSISRYEGTSDQAPATEEHVMSIYRSRRGAHIEDIFLSFGAGLQRLTLTQHQLIEIVERNADMLRLDMYSLFAVIEVRKDPYLFQVRNSSPGEPQVFMSDLHGQRIKLETGEKAQLILPR